MTSQKNSAAKKKLKPLTPANAKVLRDMIFAWLYITGGQFNHVTGAKTDAAAIKQVTDDLSSCIDMSTPGLADKIASLVRNIRVYQGAFGPVATELSSFGQGSWSGTTDHPGLVELKSIFIS